MTFVFPLRLARLNLNAKLVDPFQRLIIISKIWVQVETCLVKVSILSYKKGFLLIQLSFFAIDLMTLLFIQFLKRRLLLIRGIVCYGTKSRLYHSSSPFPHILASEIVHFVTFWFCCDSSLVIWKIYIPRQEIIFFGFCRRLERTTTCYTK